MPRIITACALAVVMVMAVSVMAFGAPAGQGAAVFQQYCAGCHGVDGSYKNLPGRSPSDIINKTRSGAGGMPSFDATVISDAMLNDMATYVTTNLDTADTTDPTIDSIAPSGTINTGSATIVVYYSDNSTGWGIDESTVVVSLDGSPLTGCDVTWASATCEVYGLGSGSHAISVSVDDYAGNTGSGNGNFTIDWSSDTTDPVISSIEPSGTIMNANASIIAYYSDNESGIDTGTVAITLDGSALSGCTVTTSYASCDVTGLAQGGHAIAVSVDDNNGNQATGNGSFTLDYSGDTTDPTVSNVQPSGTITTDSTTITADFSDAGSGIDSASVVVYLNGSPVSGCTVDAGDVSCSVSSLSDGAYTVAVNVDDLAGNTGTGNGSFTIDTTIPPCSTSFTDINGATVAVYSDPGYSAAVCQYDTLSANTDYYMQITHPSMDLNSEGTDRNRMRLKDLNNNNVNFGDGSSEVSFTQQGGGPPFVYRTTFRTPSSAGVYAAEPEMRNNPRTKEIKIKGWSLRVGSTTAYVKTFTDETFSVQTDTYSASSTVYIEMYDPTLADSTPDNSRSSVDVADFMNNKITPGVGVYRSAAHTYRMSFNLAGTDGDKALLFEFKNSGGTRLARGEKLIHIGSGDTTDPTVSNVLPAGVINTSNTTITADYSDSGSGIDSSSVVVYLDGSTVSGCTAGGSSVSCPVTGLGEGTHAVSVSVDDQAGNSGSGSGSFVVDSTDPTVTSVLPSGWQTSADASVKVYYNDGSGSGIDTSAVAVSLDGSPIAGCAVYSDSATCNVYSLSEGAHTIGGSVDDQAGNQASISGSFSVDTVSPTVSNISPGGNVTSGSQTITADYSDATSGIDTASVTVSLDGSPVSGCTVNAGDVSCDVSSLGEGTHAVSVSVDDQAGNSGSGSGSFVVDTSPPVVNNIQPSGWIGSTSATISAYYTDGSGTGVDSASVMVYLDGSPVSGCSAGAGSVSCAVSGLGIGSHTIEVDVDDQMGNSGSGSGTFTVGNGPAVTDIKPSGFTATASPVVSASLTDNSGSGIDTASVAVYLDGSPLAGCSVTASSVSCPTSGISEGAHSIDITLLDNVGTQGSGSGSFTVDSTGPTVSSIQPSGWLKVTSATVSAYYGDGSGAGVDSASVAVYLDSNPVSGCSASTTYVSCPVSSLGNGSHAISISVRDALGNSGSGSGSFSVDSQAPVVNDVTPSGNTSSSGPAITATYSDNIGIDTASVAVYLDGNPLSGCSAGASSATCSTSGLSDGLHAVTVYVSDQAGNSGSGAGSFNVDTTAPAITGIQPSGWTSTTTASVIAYYSDGSGTGVDTASVSVYMDGSLLSGCNIMATYVRCDNVSAVDGSHTLSLSVSDSLGNTGSGSGSFNVDAAAPDVTSISPGGVVTTDSFNITASFSDNGGSGIDSSSVAVYLDGVRLGGCSVSATGVNCSVSGVGSGNHSLSVYVKDALGQTGNDSVTFSAEISPDSSGSNPSDPDGSSTGGSTTGGTQGSGTSPQSTFSAARLPNTGMNGFILPLAVLLLLAFLVSRRRRRDQML